MAFKRIQTRFVPRETMKRKIVQIFPTIEYTYAVADDGTCWRILDPLVNGWIQLPDLPQPQSPFEEEVKTEATKARVRIPMK
jgi:hypothetical protein